jgi:hypothetical protein
MPAAVLPTPSLSATVGYHLEGAPAWCPGTVKNKRRPHDHQNVTIENIRGREEDFSVDIQGFEVGPFETSVTDVEDNADFKGQYYQDVIAHMKKA